MRRVAILGGGVTGLTAAFRLQRLGVPVVVYEAADRVGGVIRTERSNGYIAEFGPNTVLETSNKITDLIEDLGLTSRRMYSDPAAENRYLVRGGKPVLLPASPIKFFGTKLFSASAKLRLFTEPFVPRARAEIEESVAEFVLRRLGREFLDYAINPMVGGIYAGDPARLSVTHAFPKLHAVEQKYGSLIMGQILGARERRRRGEVSKQSAKKISFDQGLQVLTDTLAERLGDAVQRSSRVEYIRRSAGGWQVGVKSGGETRVEEFSSVLLTGTARSIAKLLISAESAISLAALAEVNYPPVSSVVLGFRREDVAHPLDGFGMLIPEVEKFNTLGTLFSSSLFPNRAPAGHVLLTSYIGGARNPELALKDGETLVKLTLEDLRRLLGVKGSPTFTHYFTFPHAIPQYEVGYGRYKELMARTESNCPGLFFAGNYRDGVSLGDSIVSGHNIAERIQKSLEDATRKATAQTPIPLAA